MGYTLKSFALGDWRVFARATLALLLSMGIIPLLMFALTSLNILPAPSVLGPGIFLIDGAGQFIFLMPICLAIYICSHSKWRWLAYFIFGCLAPYPMAFANGMLTGLATEDEIIGRIYNLWAVVLMGSCSAILFGFLAGPKSRSGSGLLSPELVGCGEPANRIDRG